MRRLCMNNQPILMDYIRIIRRYRPSTFQVTSFRFPMFTACISDAPPGECGELLLQFYRDTPCRINNSRRSSSRGWHQHDDRSRQVFWQFALAAKSPALARVSFSLSKCSLVHNVRTAGSYGSSLVLSFVQVQVVEVQP